MMCLKSCSFGSSFRGNWRFKANLCSSRLCMEFWFSNTSPEVEINIRLAATLVIFHISCPLDVPGHHIGGCGVVEVREVHLILVVKEGLQHNQIISMRTLLLNKVRFTTSPSWVQEPSLMLHSCSSWDQSIGLVGMRCGFRIELFILLFTIGPAVKEKLPQRTWG